MHNRALQWVGPLPAVLLPTFLYQASESTIPFVRFVVQNLLANLERLDLCLPWGSIVYSVRYHRLKTKFFLLKVWRFSNWVVFPECTAGHYPRRSTNDNQLLLHLAELNSVHRHRSEISINVGFYQLRCAQQKNTFGPELTKENTHFREFLSFAGAALFLNSKHKCRTGHLESKNKKFHHRKKMKADYHILGVWLN